MRFAVTELFAAKWTEAIHDEWIRNLLAQRPELADAVERTRELMDRALSQPRPYCPRRPAQTVLYQVVQGHLKAALAAQGEAGSAIPVHAEHALRRYLECGSLAPEQDADACAELQTKNPAADSIPPPGFHWVLVAVPVRAVPLRGPLDAVRRLVHHWSKVQV